MKTRVPVESLDRRPLASSRAFISTSDQGTSPSFLTSSAEDMITSGLREDADEPFSVAIVCSRVEYEFATCL